MAGINVPVGISDFEKIRRNGYYYVDKTGLILELLKGEAAEVINSYADYETETFWKDTWNEHARQLF